MFVSLSPVTSVPSFNACFFAGDLPFNTAGMYFSNCFRKAPVCTLSSKLVIISFCSAFNGVTNSLTEIYAEKNSFVDCYKIQNDLETSNLIDNTFIDQQRDSNVRVHTFSFGGKLTRNNLVYPTLFSAIIMFLLSSFTI